ncbi:MAG: pentapeptide repeat-containing protein [Bdellovibrionaceae bacterium]|nr:pentapeptide repeat-containing protein [Pseudobdellovibrionaceae bacterium]
MTGRKNLEIPFFLLLAFLIHWALHSTALFPPWYEGVVQGRDRVLRQWFVRHSDSRHQSLLSTLVLQSRFEDSDFQGARWAGNTVISSHFKKLSFRDADLRGMVFRSSRFQEVDFRGADLRDTVFLACDFQESFFDSSTRLPFSRERARALGLKEATSQ